MLWRILARIQQWFKPSFAPILESSSAPRVNGHLSEAAWEHWGPPAPPPEPPPARPSRRQRRVQNSEYRKLLKARMKFDKFVTPQGPEPVHHHREGPKPERKPAAPEPESIGFDNANEIVVGRYDDDPKNPEVLYEESEFYGQFNFRDTILDQLERYWFYLDRMRRYDSDSYGFYKQLGMQILPYSSIHAYGAKPEGDNKMTPKELEKYRAEIKLPPMFNRERPTFGCIAFGSNPKIESWESKSAHWPKFLYYTKYSKPPPEVQAMPGGDIYKLTIWWDNISDSRRKWGVPNDFAVFIDKSGEHIQILKTCKTEMIPIRKKHSLEHFHIPDHSWRIPHYYEEWARENGLDVQTHLCHMFTTVLKRQEYAQFGDVRVAVHKEDMTAIFNIDSRRLSYFFQDRDIELTTDGRRKRIFHIVRPFVDKNGVAYKMQYRGERNFTWAGYRVNVTVPGLDHFLQHEMTIGTTDSYWIKEMKKTMSEPEFGAWLIEQMNQGLGSYRKDH